jgi:phosphotransacetylase
MILETIRKRAAADIQHIILPEGEDLRTLQAAEICSGQKIAKITVIGNDEKLRSTAADNGVNLNGIEILDQRKDHHAFGRTAELYYGGQKEPLLKKLNRRLRILFTTGISLFAKARQTERSPERQIQLLTPLRPHFGV